MHVTGYTFKMQPKADDFRPILPNTTRILRFSGFGWSVSRSEFIPNWFVVAINDDDDDDYDYGVTSSLW